ncbi:MAG: putative quinol monooxygenase [Kineosporiaceae bacterium]
MIVDRGLLATLEARPGRERELAEFLEAGREIAAAEPGTVTWYAFRTGTTTFAIFDTFADQAGRDAHLAGAMPVALEAVAADLLAVPPVITSVDVLAAK